MTSVDVLNRLLDSNAKWASAVSAVEPAFFETSAKGQSPKVLWIGCSDSRVPESVLLACKPGEVFVTRNIANQVHLYDDNVLSVLTYAVINLGVEHIVVAGHSECGGAAACLASISSPSPSNPTTPLARWLTPLTDLASELQQQKATGKLTPLELVEENVKMGVRNVLESDAVKTAWGKDESAKGNSQLVGVHGWVYNVEKGRVRDLQVSVFAGDQL